MDNLKLKVHILGGLFNYIWGTSDFAHTESSDKSDQVTSASNLSRQ